MHNAVRFPLSARLRRWSLPLAAVLLLIPALLAACATENKSETVIVTTDEPEEVLVEELTERRAAEEAEAQEMQALVERQLALAEAEFAYQKAIEQMNQAHEREQARNGIGQDLKRLTVQMEYLKKEVLKAEELVRKARENEAPSDYSYNLTRERLQLLRSMYMERLGQFEMLKMEQFTEKALADND